MAGVGRRRRYSPRALLIALFVALAMILGGGGSPNPVTELLLEICFVFVAVAWLWLADGSGETEDSRADPLVLALTAIPLIIPLLQLIPLPAPVWASLPGRENELAALALVGEQSSWRPVSISPSRTLASLLSIVPAVFCLYAVGRLDLRERRLILVVIVVMAVVSSCIGAIQLTAGGAGFNIYSDHHVGWVTGFQANRNATADVLLIGLLSLAVLAAPYLAGAQKTLPLGFTRRTLGLFAGAIAVLLLAATVMTGSRAGTSLVLVAAIGALGIFAVSRSESRTYFVRAGLVLLAVALLVAAIAVIGGLSQSTAIARVAQRFSELGSERGAIWEDSWVALQQYWPIGFGMGGFEPAMLPFERLEVLNQAVPNRAHNDFLEIGIEAGVFGYVMLVIAATACIAMALRAWRDVPEMRRQVVFGLAVLIIIALHSTVDYPLRSMAVACLAGVAGGAIARRRVSVRQLETFGNLEAAKGLA